MRNKIVILGNLPLATKIIKLVQSKKNLELVGVVHPNKIQTYPDSNNEICATKYCKEKKIRKLTINEIYNLKDLKLAISARNDIILKKKFIDLFEIGIVNCHGGYLPEYKGVGGHIFPIINKEKYSGASIHWITENIDNGNIIARKKIPIKKFDDGCTLFKKINDELFKLIETYLQKLLTKKIVGKPQNLIKPNNRLKKNYFYFKKDVKRLIYFNIKSKIHTKALYWPNKV
ncbi:formyltransferase family protein [Candidatus Pelagibacter bacterium nBUS_49]|uniref:formyltransferase family protein n=1 Tax=Candidatus Pelagibacter bacterium nBUS_49 TaxID=3374196 RepID=UPI003EB92784